MQISEATLVLVVVQLIAFAYGYAKLKAKVEEINGEVKYQRAWRHWVAPPLTIAFNKLGIKFDPPPEKRQ